MAHDDDIKTSNIIHLDTSNGSQDVTVLAHLPARLEIMGSLPR